MSFLNKLRTMWNVFRSNDDDFLNDLGSSSSYRPDRVRFRNNSKSIVLPIITRIAIDVASIPIRHVQLNDKYQFEDYVDSGLNRCLSTEANIDQTGRAFIQDVVMSLCDEGSVAIVPVDTDGDPRMGEYDILTLRTGKIVQWRPRSVVINIYNDATGNKEDITLPKSQVSIIENPLYSVMNEPNGTLARLSSKLNLVDIADNQSGYGKLDLIIQLPYSVRTETKRAQAELRQKELEKQLYNSRYGVAYIDSVEKVTQLNRPAENNLMGQVEYLTRMLFGQLGITEEIMYGTADEKTWLNYYNRTIEPILSAVTENIHRSFLSERARRRREAVKYYRNMFSLVTAAEFSELADSLNRNEILTGNELRGIAGFRPADDPGADKLVNKNINQAPENEEVG